MKKLRLATFIVFTILVVLLVLLSAHIIPLVPCCIVLSVLLILTIVLGGYFLRQYRIESALLNEKISLKIRFLDDSSITISYLKSTDMRMLGEKVMEVKDICADKIVFGQVANKGQAYGKTVDFSSEDTLFSRDIANGSTLLAKRYVK